MVGTSANWNVVFAYMKMMVPHDCRSLLEFKKTSLVIIVQPC